LNWAVFLRLRRRQPVGLRRHHGSSLPGGFAPLTHAAPARPRRRKSTRAAARAADEAAAAAAAAEAAEAAPPPPPPPPDPPVSFPTLPPIRTRAAAGAAAYSDTNSPSTSASGGAPTSFSRRVQRTRSDVFSLGGIPHSRFFKAPPREAPPPPPAADALAPASSAAMRARGLRVPPLGESGGGSGAGAALRRSLSAANIFRSGAAALTPRVLHQKHALGLRQAKENGLA
jgi:hypothetical protein